MDKFIFHGTVKEYHNRMVEQFGLYKHKNGDPVFLTHLPHHAMEMALSRAEKYGGQPILLVIEDRKVENVTLNDPEIWPSCPELRPEWYTIIESERRSDTKESDLEKGLQ